MSFQAILRRLLKRGAKSPPADRTISPGSLLVGDVTESVIVPLLPDTGDSTRKVDFAAASVLERVVLGALVRKESARRIFEIGTFWGVTALTMAWNAPEEARLWTLDLPAELTPGEIATTFYAESPQSGFRRLEDTAAEREVGVALRDYRGSCEVEQLFGDSSIFDFSAFAPIDLFFVDGCHEYSSALQDTRNAWESLSPGGFIVWHDYVWGTVNRAVRDAALGVPITWISDTSIAHARKPETLP